MLRRASIVFLPTIKWDRASPETPYVNGFAARGTVNGGGIDAGIDMVCEVGGDGMAADAKYAEVLNVGAGDASKGSITCLGAKGDHAPT